MFNYIYMFLCGYVHISIEGFFTERFINICRNKKIILQDLHKEKNTYIKCNILKSDFKKVKNIAKQTKCKIKIEKKQGIPFVINRYRKRKVFAIAILVIAIFIFTITKFIWNIEVVGNEKISNEEIINLVNEHGIKIGKLKSSIDVDKISNLIRLEREDLSWIGINIKGTNAIITIQEAIPKPEIIDKNEICNIISNKDATISKIVVQSGTARVEVGDEVKKGDLLVEGIMEGTYTGNRPVHAEANIYGKITCSKEKKEGFVQNVKIKTGNEEEKKEICINNFKINFMKGVSKFENYDTISANKKIKLFSNFYIPIEIKTTKNIEVKIEEKTYSKEELKEKIERELEDDLEKEYSISNYSQENKKRDVIINSNENELTVKVSYELQEEIGVQK